MNLRGFKKWRFYTFNVVLLAAAVLSFLNAAAKDEGTSDVNLVSNLFAAAFTTFRFPFLVALEYLIENVNEFTRLAFSINIFPGSHRECSGLRLFVRIVDIQAIKKELIFSIISAFFLSP
jgi:hypothetical protein